MSSINRLQFLRGDFRGKQQTLRPPWSSSEFIDCCERCGECIKACPENILEKGRGGYPQVNFQHGECTFCERCVDQCPNDTLQKARTPPYQRFQPPALSDLLDVSHNQYRYYQYGN